MVRQRSSSSSSRWRILHPSYYLKRPRRLALLVIIFVCASVLVWDRQTLAREHEAEISKLIEENNQLQNQLKDIMKYVEETGKQTSFPKKHEENMQKTSMDTNEVNLERQNKVKAAMLHAWTAYEKYAWGFDELQPQSRSGVNNFGGLGASIVDSLDTLYIMGLDEQFQKAKEWVTNSLDFNKDVDASVFETTIRVVGGLLSAYDLSGDGVFLQKAREIADRLLPAWNTPSGIPYNTINLARGNAHNPGWTGGASILADSGTEQLEFIALSQRTGDPKYQEKVENVIKQFQSILPDDGLLPIYINPHSGRAETYAKITFGAMGDSFYEYLLKVWIQGNKTDAVKHYRDMWERSMEGLRKLIRKSSPSSYTYIAERSGNALIDKMDELACFTPGMLSLGAGHDDSEKASMYLSLAKELTRTCYNFYNLTRTRLAGENYYFNEGEDMVVGTSWNILRPETVESLMYLWRITGDEIYRDWGWDIFQAFETQSRIDSGYVGLRDVNSGEKDDTMQSFFLAETLKYLYLLFSPPSVIPLDQWVFNTEAHPLKITQRLGSEQNIEGHQFSQHKEVEVDQRLRGKFDSINRIKNNIMERAKHRERLFGRKEG